MRQLTQVLIWFLVICSHKGRVFHHFSFLKKVCESYPRPKVLVNLIGDLFIKKAFEEPLELCWKKILTLKKDNIVLKKDNIPKENILLKVLVKNRSKIFIGLLCFGFQKKIRARYHRFLDSLSLDRKEKMSYIKKSYDIQQTSH